MIFIRTIRTQTRSICFQLPSGKINILNNERQPIHYSSIWPNMQQIVWVNSSVYIIDDRRWLWAGNEKQVAGSSSFSRFPFRYSVHIFQMANGSCYHFYLIHILVLYEILHLIACVASHGYETSIFIKLKKKPENSHDWRIHKQHTCTKYRMLLFHILIFLHLFIVRTQKWSHFREYFHFTSLTLCT